MKPTYKLVFQDNEYPVFILPININGEIYIRTIGIESLQNQLVLPDMSYCNKDAEKFDEEIFFYIPDDMANKSENEIITFIETNIS